MKLFKVTAWSGFATAVKMIAGLAVAKVVAVYGGPATIAQIGQVQSLINVAYGTVASPATAGVVKFTAEFWPDEQRCQPYWRAAAKLQLFLSVFVSCVLLVSARWWAIRFTNSQENADAFIMLALALPVYAVSAMLLAITNGRQQYKIYITANIISTIAGASALLICVVMFGARAAIYALVISGIVSSVCVIGIVARQKWVKLTNFMGRVDSENIRRVAGFLAMTVTSVAIAPAWQIGLRDVIADNISWSAAGYWQAVWKISEVYLGIITIGLSTYYLPRLSELISGDALSREVRYAFTLIIPVLLLSSAVIYALRQEIINVVFSKAFEPARELFGWQLLGDVAKVASWLLSYVLIAKGKVVMYITLEIGFAVTVVCLGIPLVREFGVQGANMSYLASYVAYFMVALAYISKNVFARDRHAEV